jgi:uncharacterized delta-60 repeat protein
VRLARLTTTGAFDTSFGTNGIARLTTARIGAVMASALHADGKIAVAGYLYTGSSQVFVARFNADGTVDSAFGASGIVTLRPTNNFEPRSLLVNSAGKLLLAGFDSTAASPRNTDIVVRLNTDGSLDSTFGTGGMVSFNGNAQYAVLQPDDRILFVGFDIRRLNADGTADASFAPRCNPRPPSGTGTLCSSFGTPFAAIQPDGRIVLAGSAQVPGTGDASQFAVFRLNSDGSDDTGFGNGGAAFARFSGVDQPYGVALQGDGRIVVAGEAYGVIGSVAIARFLGGAGPTAGANYQGLWWGSPAGSESGWGINFAHQGDVIFATWFTYDTTGKAWWLAMTAARSDDGSFSGALYETHGPAFTATPFNPAAVMPAQVGSARIRFTDDSNATFTYTVNEVTREKQITRQVFGTLPTCEWGTQPNLALATQYQDLWWNAPAGSESGWGVNLTQQGNIIFGTWFTYGTDGAPMWLSVTANATGARSFSGPLYRTRGPAYNAQPFNPASVVATAVGTASFSFTDGNAGTFAYSVDGISQSKSITRQVFRPPGTVCH